MIIKLKKDILYIKKTKNNPKFLNNYRDNYKIEQCGKKCE